MRDDYIQGNLFDIDDEDYLETEEYEDEIYYDKTLGITVTQQADPDHQGLFIYRCYDDDLICFATWKLSENAARLPISSFNSSKCKRLIDREIEAYSKNHNHRFNTASSRTYPASSAISADRYVWKSNYISKDEAFEKYNKSKTLCLHKTDSTTTMLKQIYEGKGWDVINDSSSISSETLAELIDAHDRIVMLGHGTGYGLIGFIQPDHAKHLESKKLFALWCNADVYCDRYLPNKKGFFACGNMPSDEHEAKWVGYNVSHQYMDDNITYWCKLCGDVVEECLEGNADKGCRYIREKYWEKYGHSDDPDEVGITLYNYQRTKVAGQKLIDPPADYTPPAETSDVEDPEPIDHVVDEYGEVLDIEKSEEDK